MGKRKKKRLSSAELEELRRKAAQYARQLDPTIQDPRIKLTIGPEDPHKLPGGWTPHKEEWFQDWLTGGGAERGVVVSGPPIDIERDEDKLRHMFNAMMEQPFLICDVIATVVANSPGADVRAAVISLPNGGIQTCPLTLEDVFKTWWQEDSHGGRGFAGAFAFTQGGQARIFPLNGEGKIVERGTPEAKLVEAAAKEIYEIYCRKQRGGKEKS